MSNRVFRVSVLAVTLAAGLSLAACTPAPAGSKTSQKLMPQVQAAARSATSVHMTGTVTQGSQTATINVSFSGNSVAGTIGINGQSVDVLSLNGKTYIKLDRSFLRAAHAPAGVCARVCGKYVELPASSASQITGSLSLHQLITQVFNNKNMSSAAGSGCVFSPATRDGQAVLECRQGPYTIDVTAHGKPYIVYFSGPHGEFIAFSNWNTVTLPAAPAASQVVSIPTLG